MLALTLRLPDIYQIIVVVDQKNTSIENAEKVMPGQAERRFRQPLTAWDWAGKNGQSSGSWQTAAAAQEIILTTRLLGSKSRMRSQKRKKRRSLQVSPMRLCGSWPATDKKERHRIIGAVSYNATENASNTLSTIFTEKIRFFKDNSVSIFVSILTSILAIFVR